MQPFVHLHVHSQFSVLDGQASVKKLVDKAIDDGMPGVALTDHGNMFGIKELFDYCNKKNGKYKDAIKGLKKELKGLTNDDAPKDDATTMRISEIEAEIAQNEKAQFVPIFGCEMYVCQSTMDVHVDKRDTGRHLVVLAKNSEGYHNLIKLVSMAWTQGFYSHPRIDKVSLEKYSKGLIVSSACLGGEVPRLLQDDKIEEAREVIRWFKSIWGEDYYLELQRHKATVEHANHDVYPLQVKVNEQLIKLAKEEGVKLICTNDVHFVNEEDAEAHDRLICIATGKDLDDPKRMLYSKQEWFKTTEEMNALFADVPEALANTVEILSKVEQYTIEHGPILPNFPLPEGFTDNDDYLKYLVYEGAKKRWGENYDESYQERIDFELDTIKNMGFPGYFLIVQDFIKAARERGVSVGPGRGSAAGSAVAYCLGITQIDPIKYDLLFERFLNPDRISLPDIDIDFDDDGRSDVLQYVIEKYGAEKVARIITYGTMATKSAIKDVARVEKLSLSESNRLAGLVPLKNTDMPVLPNGKNAPITLDNCIKYLDDFAREFNSGDPLIHDTLNYARALEGNVRSTGVHACGVIICRDDVTDWVPVSTAYDSKNGERLLVTQYEGSVIESTGLIKMDFLGLKNLSIIKECLNNIQLTHGDQLGPRERLDKNGQLDVSVIPIDDELTYRLFCEGGTVGIFQFESAGMQKYLKELHPTVFEDLIAMNALYRPGPMDYIPDFINRKQGRTPITYDIPVMEKYLKDTYGITVYQEQVMLLSRLLADFTRGESDVLRKAMGKKQLDKLEHMKPKFIEGGKSHGHDPKVLEKIWEDWKKFASYAFNKSHATCYSWVAYQTAYLKAHYPSEYMAALLSRNISDIVTITKFMDECKRMKIAVKGPDVNESNAKFSANQKGDIRFGLEGIKGVGTNSVVAIINERRENGVYSSIYDFVERVDYHALNRRTIDTLAMAGAFDCFSPEIEREDFFVQDAKGVTFSDHLVRYGQTVQKSRQTQQMSLFGDAEDIAFTHPEIIHAESWNLIERLGKEREFVGMYLSAHPLDPYFMELEYGVTAKTQAELDALRDDPAWTDRDITFAGIVTKFDVRKTKRGADFSIMTIENRSSSFTIRLFGEQHASFRNYGVEGTAVIITARYQKRRFNDDLDLNVVNIRLLDTVRGSLVSNIQITLSVSDIIAGLCEEMKPLLRAKAEDNHGTLYFRLIDSANNRHIDLKSSASVCLNQSLIHWLLDNEVEFKVNCT